MVRPSPGDRSERQDGEPSVAGVRPSVRRGGSPSEALQPQRMPPPPKRNRRKPRGGILSVTSGVLSFLLALAIVAVVAIGYGFQRFESPGPLEAEKTFFIARGTGASESVDKLESEKLIDSGWLFKIGLFLTHKRIKAGEYRIMAHASARDILAILTEGKPLQHSVTLPEGLTSQQIVQRLKDLKDEEGNLLLSGDVHVPPEGSLMPDTYKFARGDSRESILKEMSKAQRRSLDEIWKTREGNLPIKSSYDLVTLASIVEKETGKADERPLVASVFINRLRKRMKLETDPTVIYGLTHGKGPLGRPLTRADLQTPTDFNTYKIEGLPPTPIANPGRAALEAVARPAQTKYLYFVADGTGGHTFSETYDQHLRNVARWRQIEKDSSGKLPPEADRPVAPPPPPAHGPKRTQADQPISPDMLASAAELGAGFKPSGPAHGVTPKADDRVFQVGTLRVDLGPSIEQRGWHMDGVELDGAEDIFGMAASLNDPPSNGSSASYPVPPERLAEMRARQKRYDPEGESSRRAEPAAFIETDPGDVACSPPSSGTSQRAKAFDASEGTLLDPLRNKTFDLTSSKIIPRVAVPLVSSAALGTKDLVPRAELVRQARLDCRTDVRTAQGRGGSVQVASIAPSAANGSDAPQPGASVHAFDASEGTRFDPLRNRKFDLNSAQQVPEKPLSFEMPKDLVGPLSGPETSSRTVKTAVLVARPAAVTEPQRPVEGRPSRSPSHGFDASEGTRFDPLRNRKFDLNSAQQVPEKPLSFETPKDLVGELSPPKTSSLALRTAMVGARPAAVTEQEKPVEGRPTRSPSHGFDASEGTRFDPLRQKNFDLHSAQSVPTRPISFELSPDPAPKRERRLIVLLQSGANAREDRAADVLAPSGSRSRAPATAHAVPGEPKMSDRLPPGSSHAPVAASAGQSGPEEESSAVRGHGRAAPARMAALEEPPRARATTSPKPALDDADVLWGEQAGDRTRPYPADRGSKEPHLREKAEGNSSSGSAVAIVKTAHATTSGASGGAVAPAERIAMGRGVVGPAPKDRPERGATVLRSRLTFSGKDAQVAAGKKQVVAEKKKVVAEKKDVRSLPEAAVPAPEHSRLRMLDAAVDETAAIAAKLRGETGNAAGMAGAGEPKRPGAEGGAKGFETPVAKGQSARAAKLGSSPAGSPSVQISPPPRPPAKSSPSRESHRPASSIQDATAVPLARRNDLPVRPAPIAPDGVAPREDKADAAGRNARHPSDGARVDATPKLHSGPKNEGRSAAGAAQRRAAAAPSPSTENLEPRASVAPAPLEPGKPTRSRTHRHQRDTIETAQATSKSQSEERYRLGSRKFDLDQPQVVPEF